jgi:hypothetical protein
MKKHLFFPLISLFLYLNSLAICQSEERYPDSINDGPYIFNVNGMLKVRWINNNILREDSIMPGNFARIMNEFKLLCAYNDLTANYPLKANYRQSYRKIDSIGVIADIHGEYNVYINLLKTNGIIDENLNWIFGKGHLVVLGDIFDRGNMVTEILWHLFGLEKQAAEAGGMVHVLLGNHELMVLDQDLRYINKKYEKVEVISRTKYFDLYSENSVLGNWLRSKPIAITINDIIFVHGGISIEMIKRNMSIQEINKMFFTKIVGKEINNNIESNNLKFLNSGFGPVWYRGYFTETNFKESRLDSILDFYGKKHIVVGHTSFKEIKSYFNSKILGVDAGIMNNEPGEMLIYKKRLFYKGSITGKRTQL